MRGYRGRALATYHITLTVPGDAPAPPLLGALKKYADANGLRIVQHISAGRVELELRREHKPIITEGVTNVAV